MPPPYPLHESVASKIHPEYVAFYNKHIINQEQVHLRSVAASRTSGVLIPGAGPLIPVGKQEDIAIKRKESEGPDVNVRCFTPIADKAPEGGWPALVYFHGGGWVLGNIETENVVCTNICARAQCVVITVDYRLAPENPFPAAVHDCWEALLWALAEGGKHLNLNTSRIGVGGSSAGGNLAAVMTHRAVARNFSPLKVQLLSVPVMDNTADVSNTPSYRDYEHIPALPAAKMLWYRHHYLPQKSEWANPEASPLFYPDDSPTWASVAPAIIMVGELDVLRSEGEKYAEKLKKAGVHYDLHVMEGMPHPFLAMDGVLQAGKDSITYMVEGCKKFL
ncbi:triacylglycerol lipase [Blastomyces dermatitidis ER-3]|uniref:Triacylglycerol lipase n=1 Tax=Ajellomyces dermatitidis (strain ER-3 / ATCC MYA-2586) TaxID=559297 RepID=A0ABP2ENH9_AJEDR|nr:triacylglycerol lipase [Blastomyces dermatitidis ER-3]EEQ84978.1 triacylglycerol lipase [Blastomyces dermatitidis ER-3]EQL35744.1 triacylglycerol lipase [Blastomyces dermatitidis ATCC 26199]